MILLLGGTSETAPIATALAEAGYHVLVSTATDIALDIGDHRHIHRTCGRLDMEGLASCAKEHDAEAIVDAAHPYATELHQNALAAAQHAGIPYLRFDRPATSEGYAGNEGNAGVHVAATHDEAARLAFSFGQPVLLTAGSRNLAPYVQESKRRGLGLVARVLPHDESLEACRNAGIRGEDIIQGRGPFTMDENRELIRAHSIGVLVTKDSGAAGGVKAKVDAARAEGCEVVVVARPPSQSPEAFTSVSSLLHALTVTLARRQACAEGQST